MDTPEKKAQPSPSSLLSKFEDSPVFNYISNLSPITPYNLTRSGHSFQLFGFTSPQSLQRLPTNFPNESKIESGTKISDLPKNNCSQNGGEETISGTSCTVAPATLHVEKVHKSDSTQELTAGETNDSSKMVIELPKSLKYESGSPENSVACSGAAGELDCNSVIQGVSQEADCSFRNEMGVHGIPSEHNKQACNWEKLIYEASDVLNCQTPAKDKHVGECDDKSVDSGTLSFVATVLQPPNENADGTQKLESIGPLRSCEKRDLEDRFSQPVVGNPNETSVVPASKARAVLPEEEVHNSSTQVNGKQQMTSRCLVYQMSGARYRKLLSDPADNPPTSKPSASSKTSNGKGEAAGRHRGNKISSKLPGIGLHLNALAATSREKIIVQRQTLTCRKQLISSPCITSSSDALTPDTKPLSTPMSPADTAGMSSEDPRDELQVTGNASQDPVIDEGSEFLHDSPKKKRKKSEYDGETDSCKRCNCKRSKCLKLYCECFAAGLYCVEPCNCQDCFNKPIHEETVLETRRQIESRNPLAFAPKVIRFSGTPNNGVELSKTPASARHKRGCNCKKSGCLKKYCECFQGGVGCSVGCRCEGCKNTFGRKDGNYGIRYEETRIFDKSGTDASSYDEVFKTDEESLDQATPEPSNNLRQPVRRPFHFGGTGSQFPPTLRSCTTPKTEEDLNVAPDVPAFEEDLNVAPEDEAPEMFECGRTLSTYVKSTSPNSKRVSPPHYDFEPSPAWKSCRKLILRSIPSLPTSNPEKKPAGLREELQ